MAKKVANSGNSLTENAGVVSPKRTPVSKAKKHIKAQAAGVAAAVEGFVHAIATPVAEEAPAQLSPEVALKASPKIAPTISQEEIAVLAYEYYLDRKGESGSQADDWLRAEAALKAKSASAS